MSAALKLPESHATAIESLAVELAEILEDVAAATATLAAAEHHRNQIAERISSLARQRDEIASRRASGSNLADDGGNLALILVDSEGLQAMLPGAAARVENAARACDAAAAKASHLREEIAKAEARAAREFLVAHAEVLATQLRKTIEGIEMATARAGIGGWPPWGASAELRQKLRILAVQRGEGGG